MYSATVLTISTVAQAGSRAGKGTGRSIKENESGTGNGTGSIDRQRRALWKAERIRTMGWTV